MSRRFIVGLCLLSFAAGYGVKSILENYNIRLIVIEKKRYATRVEEPPMPIAVEIPQDNLPETKTLGTVDDKASRSVSSAPKNVITKPVEKPKGFAFPIDATDLALLKKNVGQRAVVVGEVRDVFHSEKSDTYFLKFSDSRSGFTSVIFKSVAQQFRARKVDIDSFKAKRVKVNGTIKDHPKYGLQFILNSPDEIKIIK